MTQATGLKLRAERAEWERARAIVRQWGWNVTSYQILNPGFSFWIDARGDAVVGYIERHGVWVVGGAPICADERLAEVMAAFERAARGAGARVLYFCAEERLAAIAAGDTRRVTFPIGAQPFFSPVSLAYVFSGHASLRAQLHRARNKGVMAETVGVNLDELMPSLRRCLEEWRATRGLPPLHFLIETDTLQHLDDRVLFVARRRDMPVAFAVVTPIPARHGWLIEQIVRGRDAPNGTAEMLVHEVARLAAERGVATITLGLAPLAWRAPYAIDQSPGWLRTLLHGLRSHARNFYNFEGLEQFKAKFRPDEWAPVYASAGPACGTARALLAVSTAFSGERLRWFVPHTLGRALVREVKSMVRGR